jgi:hypothetical protein
MPRKIEKVIEKVEYIAGNAALPIFLLFSSQAVVNAIDTIGVVQDIGPNVAIALSPEAVGYLIDSYNLRDPQNLFTFIGSQIQAEEIGTYSHIEEEEKRKLREYYQVPLAAVYAAGDVPPPEEFFQANFPDGYFQANMSSPYNLDELIKRLGLDKETES